MAKTLRIYPEVVNTNDIAYVKKAKEQIPVYRTWKKCSTYHHIVSEEGEYLGIHPRNPYAHRHSSLWSETQAAYEGDMMVRWMVASEQRIFVRQYFILRGFSPNIYTNLCRMSRYFQEKYDYCLSMQESRLVHAAIFTKFNPSYMFILKALHNWEEKTDKELQRDTNIVIVKNYEGSNEDKEKTEDKKRSGRITGLSYDGETKNKIEKILNDEI